MPGVILILGLVAAAIYAENGWYNVAAIVAGLGYFLMTMTIASVAASAQSNVLKGLGGISPRLRDRN